MADSFFLGFAGHAHTMNDVETDQQKELELRKRNSPEEAERLTGMVLDKIERDLSDSGYGFEDVKLLVLYLSYRGEPVEKDALICGSVLRAIESRFGKHSATQLRLIGHTTGGEYENEDLVLKEISGIGYNGLSLLALVTDLPIGVGRTWGLRTAEQAIEQGREMARDAWVDFSQQTVTKEHLHMGKTLLVLPQGSNVGTPGYEDSLARGIANFMSSTREARIMNVIGGCSGDGFIAKHFHQFYGRLKEHSLLKTLEGEAVCALIPSLGETSMGLDTSAYTIIGKEHAFSFNAEKEPHFKYIKCIDEETSSAKYAEVISENEVEMAKKKGLPIPDKKTIQTAIQEAIQLSQAQKTLLIFNPIVYKYAFAFPFGNYCCAPPMRMVGEDIELMFPIRSFTPKMSGYFMMGDYEKVQKGAHRVYDMLREDKGFSRTDATFIVSCCNRRLSEVMAGRKSGTEPEILKEGLSSTQMIGFLAYGEMAFTHLIQEPYTHAFTCWGITFHSITAEAREVSAVDQSVEISKSVAGRVATGHPTLDKLLRGGIPENYAVALTAPSCGERDSLVTGFLRKGIEQHEATFFVTVDPGKAKSLAQSEAGFRLFVCNPQADVVVQDQPNIVKLKGVENLTNISIALSSAISKLEPSLKGPKRMCIELLSDVLLQHHAVQTRRWLTPLITELESNGFTTLAVIDPRIHPSDELYAILGLFDGEISLHERQTEKGFGKYLKINSMSNQEYLESELPFKREISQRRK